MDGGHYSPEASQKLNDHSPREVCRQCKCLVKYLELFLNLSDNTTHQFILFLSLNRYNGNKSDQVVGNGLDTTSFSGFAILPTKAKTNITLIIITY